MIFANLSLVSNKTQYISSSRCILLHKSACCAPCHRVDWYSLDGLTPLGHRGRLVKSARPEPRVATVPLTPQLFPVQELLVEEPSEARFLAMPSGFLHLYVINHSGLVTWFSQKGIQM